MTEFSFFSNCIPGSFITASGLKSFKIIKEASGARKLIGYFTTWDQVSKCINSQQLWNNVSFSWCRYSTSKFSFQKHRSVRFDNAKNSNSLSKATSHLNTNLKHFSGNHRFHNQNKKDNNTPNSDFSTKKNSRFKTNQSSRSNMNILIAGLKAFLKQLT
ncbi:hypothetical protein RclHR1_08180001 [Rhizophagus clarus]|uniref:Uncharacterized protein n=1 Tax=Rhizophagus clarus TaxID=94130 RepID=A0A2Z6SMN0_9GLOM|nr:hypothetical protein RclHR1_08180001 [Rhizophagus clarus]GES87188.1 hypothetical protein GLOIN_2v1765605 [Rhizophagus clarus]